MMNEATHPQMEDTGSGNGMADATRITSADVTEVDILIEDTAHGAVVRFTGQEDG